MLKYCNIRLSAYAKMWSSVKHPTALGVSKP
jgi:hypothetical protein